MSTGKRSQQLLTLDVKLSKEVVEAVNRYRKLSKQLLALDVKLSKEVVEAVNR